MSRAPLLLDTTAPAPLALDDVRRHLELFPDDPRLRAFCAQLARREGRLQEMHERLGGRRGRRAQQRLPDGLALFTGALAVSETLQLDAFALSDEALAAERPASERAHDVSALAGPQVKSHPFDEMPARAPDVPRLFAYCPADQWAAHLKAGVTEAGISRAVRELGAELAAQTGLALRGDDLSWLLDQWGLAPPDHHVGELGRALDGAAMAVTGCDVAFASGIDITVLIDVGEDERRARALLAHLERLAERVGASPTFERVLDHDVLELRQADGAVQLLSVRLDDRTLAISNSTAALRRVLETAGHARPSLAAAAEVAVMRHFLPVRADERLFVYLSDSFIRRLLGPAGRIASLRRERCRQLRSLLGFAGELFAIEHGRVARDIAELYAARAAPGLFGAGALACPEHGALYLDGDSHPRCEVHGPLRGGVGLAELEPRVQRITDDERAAYQAFVGSYTARWSRYFDPIGVRVDVQGDRTTVETMVLPLIDNSLYQGLRTSVGTLAPRSFAALPRPQEAIFGVEALVPAERLAMQGAHRLSRRGGDRPGSAELLVYARGTFSSEVGLSVLDHAPLFELDLRSLLGIVQGAPSAARDLNGWMWWALGALASLHSPVRLAVGVIDADRARRFVRALLTELSLQAQRARLASPIEAALDVSDIDEGGDTVAIAVGFAALRLRLFVRVTNSAVLISNTIAALDAESAAADAGDAHARLLLAPSQQRRGAPHAQYARRERERRACFAALGRAVLSAPGRASFSCPSGGALVFEDGSPRCTAHGDPRRPRNAPGARASGLDLHDLSARLVFEDGGVRAILEISRAA